MFIRLTMGINKFDWGLLFVFILNMVLDIGIGNIESAIAWFCATMTLGRILIHNLDNDEKI